MLKDHLSVIILTHNEELNLPACLRSLESLKPQIYIIDSGSTDSTEAVAKKFGANFYLIPGPTKPPSLIGA